MKLLAITIVYNSNINELYQNLKSYINLVDQLILWDNSEKKLDFSSILATCPEIMICQDGINYGLPKAYNWAVHYAKTHGYTHLMTMDQDSCFEDFADYYEHVVAKNHPGICSCAISQSNPKDSEWTDINDSAQSGSIFPLEMIDKIGLFREDFFIGMVDAEMCLKAQEHGYSTLQYNGSYLIHHIGSGRMVSFLGHAVQVSDYSALRHYYDSRNRILMWHEFPYDFNAKNKVKHFLGRVKVMIKIVLFENNKTNKIFAIIRGTWYGLLNRPKPF